MTQLSVLRRFAAVLAVSAAVATPPAHAWHEQGHKDVGAIADRLLADHPRAAAQVRAILGNVTLEQAGPWGDCVRPNSGPPNFRYNGNPRRDSVCRGFADDDRLRAQMEQYVRNNWTTCPEPRRAGCHTQYHFVDLAVQRTAYRRGLVGTAPFDIVQAINAAVAVLRSPSCRGPNPATSPVRGPAPFRYSCAHALMMLTHFIGDLHQPLHVGGVYLDPDGNVVDPDSSPAERRRVPSTETRGGNLLHFSASENSTELHGHWDETGPDRFTDAELSRVRPTPGSPTGWAVAWAGDSLALAGRVLAPLRFSEKQGDLWVVRFQDREEYDRRMGQTQHAQIVKGGAHLAQLLVAIWPDR